MEETRHEEMRRQVREFHETFFFCRLVNLKRAEVELMFYQVHQ